MRAYTFIPYYFVHSKHRSSEYLLVFGASWNTGIIPYSQVRKWEQMLLRFSRITR